MEESWGEQRVWVLCFPGWRRDARLRDKRDTQRCPAGHATYNHCAQLPSHSASRDQWKVVV